MRAGGLRALALLLVGALLAACAGQEADPAQGTGPTAIADILGNPERYLGQELTLSGEVGNALSSRVFRMVEAQDGLLDGSTGNDGLLVVIPEDAVRPPDIDSDMDVQVTGELLAYDRDALDPDIGTMFVPAVEGISEGDPMLLAERVLVRATIADLDEHPGAYLHNVVTVTGQVAELLREGVVRLEDPNSGGDVLVILANADLATPISQGEAIVVTGQVRQFNLQELGGELELDLDAGIFAGWENRAVIVAETVDGG